MIDSHPTEVELLQLTLDDSSTARNASVARHVLACAACRASVDALRSQANALRFVAGRGDHTEECLDEESIAALAEGSIDVTGAPATFAHVFACERCARELASAARLLDDPEVRRELGPRSVHGTRARARRQYLIGSVSVAAAAALLVLVLRPTPSSNVSKAVYREESVTAAAAPVLISPIGIAAAADTFRWTAVPRADRYRLAVFDRDGSVVWEAITRDTAIALPALLWRPANSTYLWRVEARVGWEDRWAASDLGTLTTRRPPAR